MTESTTLAPIDPYTGAGLIDFLDAAIEKGWINVGSAKALKTATLKIFEVESGWESMDLRNLDADSIFERFRNLRRNSYSDDSMRVYRTRFGQALQMHLARLDGENNWKSYGPSARMSSSAKCVSASKATAVASAVAANTKVPEEALPVHGDSTSGSAPLIRFSFPLRDAVDVWLTLPRDLASHEAERLAVFIRSLARAEVQPTACP